MNTNLIDTIFYFAIYSTLGWMCEVVYCSIPEKKLVQRGFLKGPYCPIYGFGALIILLLLHPFIEKPVLLFVLAMAATTLLEFVTSWLLEKMFNKRWWDYSKQKFNLNGRICLKNTLLFGMLGVIIAYFVHPAVAKLISHIEISHKYGIATFLTLVFAIDLFVTVKSLCTQKRGARSSDDSSGSDGRLHAYTTCFFRLEQKHTSSDHENQVHSDRRQK